MLRFALPMVLVACSAPAAPVNSTGDIAFWTGEGANHAAIAFDWDGDSDTDEALVWGYRWDGAATGEDALLAVIAADPRAFAKLYYDTDNDLGVAVVGVGYDADNDGAFAVSDATSFDAATGIAVAPQSDGATPLGADLYAEGWEDAYWHYGRRSAGGVWQSSTTGATDRLLSDGDWDSWALAVTRDRTEFAQTLPAAPAMPIDGDVNGAERVDLADYTTWRDTLDTPGGAMASDYGVWRDAMLGASPNIGTTAAAVPEPAAWLTIVGWIAVSVYFNRPRPDA